MSFPQNLRTHRIRLHMTQAELGKRLNLSRAAISNYELGNIEPSMDTLKKLSFLFQTSLDDLILNKKEDHSALPTPNGHRKPQT